MTVLKVLLGLIIAFGAIILACFVFSVMLAGFQTILDLLAGKFSKKGKIAKNQRKNKGEE